MSPAMPRPAIPQTALPQPIRAPQPAPEPAVTPGSATLTLTGTTRDFADRRVLGPIDLRVDPGVLAVIGGANGAGKTTLLRVAAGLLAPTDGTRTCTGRAVYVRPGAGARHPLTVGRALTQTAMLTGTGAGVLAHAVSVAGLTELTQRRVSDLSAGQHARLSMALAVATSPRLACLDEPTAHLDPSGVEQVRAVVGLLLQRGTSVLLVSHSPEQFANTADAVLRLEHGRLRETGC